MGSRVLRRLCEYANLRIGETISAAWLSVGFDSQFFTDDIINIARFGRRRYCEKIRREDYDDIRIETRWFKIIS